PAERSDPAVVDGSRRQRIARGSGTTTQDVNQLLRQFKEAQAMMRSPGMLSGLLGGGRVPGGAKGAARLAEALGAAGDDLGAGGTAGWPADG
ncbi:MAG TPA: signal recognition particle protein, partial [Acidimicrobiaceae bacterium]|nr:signal recognition particle protein [Acidimicrobiaceae bacterium]